jgi:hypothetical protein
MAYPLRTVTALLMVMIMLTGCDSGFKPAKPNSASVEARRAEAPAPAESGKATQKLAREAAANPLTVEYLGPAPKHPKLKPLNEFTPDALKMHIPTDLTVKLPDGQSLQFVSDGIGMVCEKDGTVTHLTAGLGKFSTEQEALKVLQEAMDRNPQLKFELLVPLSQWSQPPTKREFQTDLAVARIQDNYRLKLTLTAYVAKNYYHAGLEFSHK